MACKNLEVAVAVSKRPGYFEYYVAPDGVQAVERQGALKTLTAKITRVAKELDELSREIKQRDDAAKREQAAKWAVFDADADGGDERAGGDGTKPPPAGGGMQTLEQWRQVHGQPKPAPHGHLTVFQKSPKIYGGTAHHRAFKTQGSSMKAGTLIR